MIAEHIAAVNAFDIDRIMATFDTDAYVNDNHREIWGPDRIRQFFTREFIGDHVTMDVTEVVDHHGDIIVRARLRRHLRQDQPPRRADHVQLLQPPRRQDRQPHRHPQPTVPLLTRTAEKGVQMSQVEEARWGSVTKIRLPGGGEVGLCQPRHEAMVTPR